MVQEVGVERHERIETGVRVEVCALMRVFKTSIRVPPQLAVSERKMLESPSTHHPEDTSISIYIPRNMLQHIETINISDSGAMPQQSVSGRNHTWRNNPIIERRSKSY